MTDLLNKINESVQFLRQQTSTSPKLGMVLGSGLSELAQVLEKPQTIPYSKIPHFPVSTVEGHAGNLIVGTYASTPIVFLQGRFHYYEGYDLQACTFPIRVLGAWGINTLVLTNAAGGIRGDLEPGDLVLIRDHINLLSQNPLRGKNLDNFGPRFPDMSEPYSPTLRKLAWESAKVCQLSLKEGVYLATQGPCYETKSEIQMMKTLGADLVGMSTVPETIVARHMSIPVLGISLVTNKAAGLGTQALSHEEVMLTSQQTKKKFLTFLQQLLPRLLNPSLSTV